MSEQNAYIGPSRGRFWAVALAAVVGVLVVVVVGAWARLYIAPLTIPSATQARIEARIDSAMASGRVEIGDMAFALPEGGRAPALEFRDVVVNAPDGTRRAAFPTVRLRLAGSPLMRGQMRVRRIAISGAALNLRRGADGRLDLDLSGDPGAPQVSLAQTLAQLDQMFAGPAFSHLEEVVGDNIEVILSDAEHGRDLRLHSAQARLTPEDVLRLEVEGQLTGSRDATLSLSVSRDGAQAETLVGVAFESLAARDLAASAPVFAWMDQIRAPIDGAFTAQVSDAGTLGAVEGWLAVAEGELLIAGLDPQPFTELRAEVIYDPTTRRALFDELMVAADPLSFQGRGHMDIDGSGQVLTGQVVVSDIVTNPSGLFPQPLTLDGAAFDLRASFGDDLLVEVGQATLHDDDLRAIMSGRVSAGDAGLTLSVDAHMPRVTRDEALQYWPAAAIPNTRWWVEERLQSATATGADFALRLSPDAAPQYELSLDFNDADLVAVPAAPPLLGGSGYLHLRNSALHVGAAGGTLGGVALAGSRMAIADTSLQFPTASFDLALSGSVSDVMGTLAGPPFAVLDASGYTADEIGEGQVTATATLATQLIEREDAATLAELNVTANASVIGFAADELIPDRRLTANRLDVALTPAQLSVSGRAALDGVPVSGAWTVQLAPDAPLGSLVQARATLDRRGLAAFGVSLPDWLVSGRGEADVTVRLHPERAARLSLSSDLSGVALAIPPLAWGLPAGRTGSLNAEITLGTRPEVTELTVSAAGLTLDGAVTFTQEGWLNRFTAGQFTIGTWLDVQGSLIGRGAQSPSIEISSGSLDFRTMPSLINTEGSSQGDVGPLDISLDRMQITEGIALTGLRAALEGSSMSGSFRGRVNNGTQFNGQLVASRNGPTVRLRSDDGGAVMRSAGVFDNMHGGAFDLILAPRAEVGAYDGRLTITGPRLRNAPVMADLLNLISVVGLLEQLSGDGINLGTVDGLFRITPTAITLTEGTALGPAIGISMDGVYDVASERYEMQGVVSPLYIVNGLAGALFARRSEGLFGFNYRLIGDSADTRVTVNPLSILTPGIFREIFRAPPPDFSTGN